MGTAKATSKRGKVSAKSGKAQAGRQLSRPGLLYGTQPQRTPQRFTWSVSDGRVGVEVFEVERPGGAGFRWEWTCEFKGVSGSLESAAAFTHFEDARENVAKTLDALGGLLRGVGAQTRAV